MRLYGGERASAYKRTMVWQCDWPKEEASKGRYEIFITESNGVEVGQIVTDYKPNLLADYHTVACVPPVHYERAKVDDPLNWIAPPNTVRMLPQWLEYNLMHGVDHFLFYTFDDTAKEVMDIYRPYLDSGVATRIHMLVPNHLKGKTGWTLTADDKSRFNSGWTTNDCLYRTKNHAKWVMPTLDVDEFFNAKTSIKHFLDSMTKDKARNGIHSLTFDRYVFLRPPETEPSLLISSPKREAHTQNAARKFVINPSVVNVLFVHYPSSWNDPARQLDVPAKMAVFNHYRTIDENVTSFTDPSLVAEASALQKALENRFKMPWGSLFDKLARPKNLPTLASTQSQLGSYGYSMSLLGIDLAPRKDSVLYLIRSGGKHSKERLSAINQTWGAGFLHGRQSRIVTFLDNPEALEECKLLFGDNHAHGLTCLESLNELALSERNDYTWLYIADDDVYIRTPNLERHLASLDPEEPKVWGRPGCGWCAPRGVKGLCGGGGYFISRKNLQMMVKKDKFDFVKQFNSEPNQQWADIRFSCVATNHGLQLVRVPGMYSNKEQSIAGEDAKVHSRSEPMISQHYVDPDDMRRLHAKFTTPLATSW